MTLGRGVIDLLFNLYIGQIERPLAFPDPFLVLIQKT
jgi:hypothetical protein